MANRALRAPRYWPLSPSLIPIWESKPGEHGDMDAIGVGGNVVRDDSELARDLADLGVEILPFADRGDS